MFFNGSGSDSDGTVVAYLWRSDIDGIDESFELSTEANFSSSDLSLGYHTIEFVVQDNDGAWNMLRETGNLWIYASPVAVAGNDATVEPGGTVQFSGAATDEDGTITKYEWDFDGDGVYEWSSTENGLDTHIYNSEGTYTANLRVTDSDGFTATDSRIITVKAADSQEKVTCVDGDSKPAGDGCNQCICNNEEWVCTEVACNPDDKDEDRDENESSLPSVSMIPALISIGLIAIFRRK